MIKMEKNTFWEVILRTLDKIRTPLSPKEIWEKANEVGTIEDFVSNGKTPWATIGAYCYWDINTNGDNSTIIQTSQRPAQFYLRRLGQNIDFDKLQKQKEVEQITKEKNESKKFNERDLHTVVVSYASFDTHFKANLKTIYHENSLRSTKGQNEWLHPDLVGVYFPFKDYAAETREIQDHLKISSIKLFSFELKKYLNFSNLRQSFFQAVSNSSWANEGYLVTLDLDDDPAFRDEIRRLNNAFGIGLIKLNADNAYESEILSPAKVNQEIDWDTVNRLANENTDFKEFLKLITEDCKLGKVKSQYDKIFEPEELIKYMGNKGIKNVL
jgi:uncharacterized protein